MSIREANVQFEYKKRGIALTLLFSVLEFVLSAFISITIASHVLFPEQAEAATGVSQKLAYQGRLTDTSGNPLSGTYYFCASIYDATSGGTKLWPTGTPTPLSATVSSGVFNIGIGDADVLGFDFSSNDTTYLNIEVASSNGTCGSAPFESLTPRQRIDATAYARVAADVYGTALKTSATKVQVGTGTGAATPIWMSLDWRNVSDTIGGACPSGSFNGAIWYNSSITRSLMCKTSTIVALDNASEIVGIQSVGGPILTAGSIAFSGSNNITVTQVGNTLQLSVPSQSIQTQNLHNITLSGNTAGVMAQISSGTLSLAGGNNITLSQNGNAVTIIGPAAGGGGVAIGGGASTATNGTVVFSNANGVSFGLNNGTMTASVNAGGGGGVSVSGWNIPYGVGPGAMGNMSAVSNMYMSIIPFRLLANLTVDNLRMVLSAANTATSAFSLSVSYGIYTLNGSTLSLASTATRALGVSANANNTLSYNGLRAYDIASGGVSGSIQGNAWNLTPGNYWMGVWVRTSNYGTFSLFGTAFGSTNFLGAFGNASKTWGNIGVLGPGVFSATFSSGMPTTIASNAIQNNIGNSNRIPYIYFGDDPANL